MITLAITGTPCSGKTKLAKKLSLLLDYTYFDIGLFIKEARIHTSYDRKRRCYVVDSQKLAKSLLKVREKALQKGDKGIIFDSHMAHFLPSNKVDVCIVTKCSLKTLQRRLTKRGYGKSKIRENLDSEIFDTCLVEATEKKHNVITFDTTKTKISDVKKLSKQILKKNIPGPDKVRT